MGCSNSKAEVAAKQDKPDAPRRRRSRHRRSADPEPDPPERISSAGAENPLQTQPRLFEVIERNGTESSSPQQQRDDDAHESSALITMSPTNQPAVVPNQQLGTVGGDWGTFFSSTSLAISKSESVADWAPRGNRSLAEREAGPLGGAGGGGGGVGNLGSLPSHTNEQEESASSPTIKVQRPSVYSPPVHVLGPLGPSTHCPGFSSSSSRTPPTTNHSVTWDSRSASSFASTSAYSGRQLVGVGTTGDPRGVGGSMGGPAFHGHSIRSYSLLPVASPSSSEISNGKHHTENSSSSNNKNVGMQDGGESHSNNSSTQSGCPPCKVSWETKNYDDATATSGSELEMRHPNRNLGLPDLPEYPTLGVNTKTTPAPATQKALPELPEYPTLGVNTKTTPATQEVEKEVEREKEDELNESLFLAAILQMEDERWGSVSGQECEVDSPNFWSSFVDAEFLARDAAVEYDHEELARHFLPASKGVVFAISQWAQHTTTPSSL